MTATKILVMDENCIQMAPEKTKQNYQKQSRYFFCVSFTSFAGCKNATFYCMKTTELFHLANGLLMNFMNAKRSTIHFIQLRHNALLLKWGCVN